MLIAVIIVTAALLVLLAVAALRMRAQAVEINAVRREAGELRSELSDGMRLADEFASKLRAILSATEDAILIADSAGECRMLNDQAKAYFGALTDRRSLLAATQSAELDALVRRAHAATPEDHPVAGEIVLRSSGERTVQVLVKRIEAVHDSPEEYLVLLRDITDLRRLETVRRDFVANVSHELRTPLSSIKAMAETLLDGALDDPGVARPFLETIISETDRLVRLSADLLVLSRIELRPVLKEDSDVAMLIDGVVSRLDNQRDKAGLSLLTGDIERPLIAPCDTDEVAQVLVNLLDNAIKYTPRGGSVRIAARRNEGQIVVEISDTGIGILQQDLPRLFERFYRTDKARSRQSGGTGLGLSIVKHIVERHGGGLWVRSDYNRGSTFGFSLPCNNAVSDAAERRQPDWSTGDSGEYLVVNAADAPLDQLSPASARSA